MTIRGSGPRLSSPSIAAMGVALHHPSMPASPIAALGFKAKKAWAYLALELELRRSPHRQARGLQYRYRLAHLRRTPIEGNIGRWPNRMVYPAKRSSVRSADDPNADDRLTAVRERLGGSVRIAIDGNGKWICRPASCFARSHGIWISTGLKLTALVHDRCRTATLRLARKLTRILIAGEQPLVGRCLFRPFHSWKWVRSCRFSRT